MTRETKHTPGNWHTNDGQIYPIETGETIATVHYFDKTNEEHQATARLIAAAPFLLATLTEIVDNNCVYEVSPTIIEFFERAIQKATQP
jgi:hypothetical protein